MLAEGGTEHQKWHPSPFSIPESYGRKLPAIRTLQRDIRPVIEDRPHEGALARLARTGHRHHRKSGGQLPEGYCGLLLDHLEIVSASYNLHNMKQGTNLFPSCLPKSGAAAATVLDPPPEDLFHLVHEPLVAGELSALHHMMRHMRQYDPRHSWHFDPPWSPHAAILRLKIFPPPLTPFFRDIGPPLSAHNSGPPFARVAPWPRICLYPQTKKAEASRGTSRRG